ncbi:hypothetical protein H6F75_24680 [Nodosilinea sp. FACHB-131]|uniref:hypothetical protein n=1 Tax=Cyanophyceae TaxID=3028117 RepID=UPI001687A2ED|nr:hypothetical protein [Nodosilinea sp. FACHB-131]MBD1876688.1 hypothetical protein [Nodosilinea sp. FACHB-131]
MTQISRFYSVYLSRYAVELCNIDDSGTGDARLVCSQVNYHNAPNFALQLAHDKNLPLNNLITDNVEASL